MTKRIPWLTSVSESKTNYWTTYVVDFALLAFFLGWDAARMNVAAAMSAAREGHEKHHEDPTAYIAMPYFVTPILFLPIHQFFAV